METRNMPGKTSTQFSLAKFNQNWPVTKDQNAFMGKSCIYKVSEEKMIVFKGNGHKSTDMETKEPILIQKNGY